MAGILAVLIGKNSICRLFCSKRAIPDCACTLRDTWETCHVLGCRLLEKFEVVCEVRVSCPVPCETFRLSHAQDSNLPLSVWALTMHAQEVLEAQDGFVWTHGTYQVRTLTRDHEDVPPLEGWARMWTQPTDREVCMRYAFFLSMTRYMCSSFRVLMVLHPLNASCEECGYDLFQYRGIKYIIWGELWSLLTRCTSLIGLVELDVLSFPLPPPNPCLD